MSSKQQVIQAALELKRRAEALKPIIDDSYPQQAKFVADKSRFVAALCTRRAGKSHGLAIKFYNAAKKYPGSLSAYVGLTRTSAETIMWPIFKEINEKYKIGATLTSSDLEITLPNEAKIKLFGADQKGFIDKLRGPKYPMCAIDEAQAFKSHIETLVDDVFTPAVGDYLDGQIILTGTPGPVPKGFFHEASLGAHGFVPHKWTVYDNPYFPRPHEFVKELFEKKKWTKENPTYRREWLGEWVADTDALVYKYNSALNDTLEIPTSKEWFYVLGVDLGYDPDPSAFVLCCFNFYRKELFITECYKENKMIVSDVAERIKYYMKQHPDLKVVADLGAQGKMIGEEINQRYGLNVQAAEKHGKAGFIEIMNSDFQKGLIKVHKSIAADMAEEWQNLIWDTEKDQKVEDSRYPNHLADAALYAWRFCYNYAAEVQVEGPAPNTDEFMIAQWEAEAEKLARSDKERSEDDEWI